MSEIKENPEQVAEVQRLFVQHVEVIKGFVYGLLPDRFGADDVVQETFLAVTKMAHRFELGTNFPKWACSVARFKVMESHHWGKRMRPLDHEVLEALMVSPAAYKEDPRRDHLAVCFEKLPASVQKVMRLRYGGDHKPGAIAGLVNLAAETVYSMLSRARSELRECIRMQNEEPLNGEKGSR